MRKCAHFPAVPFCKFVNINSLSASPKYLIQNYDASQHSTSVDKFPYASCARFFYESNSTEVAQARPCVCPHYTCVQNWLFVLRFNIVWSLRDWEVACSAPDLQCWNFESCIWRAVSSHSLQNLQEVLLDQFNLYVHKGDVKPHSFILSCFCMACQQIQNHWPAFRRWTILLSELL